MNRPQFTVRRLMAAVAIVSVMLAILAALEKMGSRQESYRLASEAERKQMLAVTNSGPSMSPAEYARIRRKMNWHLSRMVIYDRAYQRPWLPVAPLPPEPK